MKKYLKNYISEFEKELNIPLMTKEYDRPLVEYVKDCFLSLEVLKNIKILKFKYNDNESDIDINKYILNRDKKKLKKERFKYKFISDDRVGVLSVWIELSVYQTNVKTNEPELKKKVIRKDILIPIQDENGYFHIKGKKYYLIFQLVEKSTYNTKQCITLKSLMPITLKRVSTKIKDIDDNEYDIPTYNIFVFKKEIPVFLFYAASGVTHALYYLNVAPVVKVVEEVTDNEKYIYFKLSSKLFVQVHRDIFNRFQYVQSIVAMFVDSATNRLTINNLDDKEYWIKKLGINNKLDKGKDILVFFDRLMDVTTSKVLKLPNYRKEDIYALITWMMQNFTTLRTRNNVDLENKRLRCNEYISALLTMEFSKRLNRVISLGNKLTIDDLKDIFKFSGNILIQQMHVSGVLRYDENINDMTFFSKFKYTAKGVHSLGNKNENNISMQHRDIHPSHSGYFDILVCGNSDPGLSGLISPFTKMNGLYFNNENEPDEFILEFKKALSEVLEKEGIEYIDIAFNDKNDYDTIMNNIVDFNNDKVKVFGTSNNKIIVTVENDECDNLDDDVIDETSSITDEEVFDV